MYIFYIHIIVQIILVTNSLMNTINKNPLMITTYTGTKNIQCVYTYSDNGCKIRYRGEK